MNKYIKAIAIFTGGLIMGVISIAHFIIKRDYLRKPLVEGLANKIYEVVFGERKRYNSRISYRNFYEKSSARRDY